MIYEEASFDSAFFNKDQAAFIKIKNPESRINDSGFLINDMSSVFYIPAGCWAIFMAQACLINCTSPCILTSSLTITPPASNAAFQLSPQSLRLIFPVKENPALVFPQGSF